MFNDMESQTINEKTLVKPHSKAKIKVKFIYFVYDDLKFEQTLIIHY